MFKMDSGITSGVGSSSNFVNAGVLSDLANNSSSTLKNYSSGGSSSQKVSAKTSEMTNLNPFTNPSMRQPQTVQYTDSAGNRVMVNNFRPVGDANGNMIGRASGNIETSNYENKSVNSPEYRALVDAATKNSRNGNMTNKASGNIETSNYENKSVNSEEYKSLVDSSKKNGKSISSYMEGSGGSSGVYSVPAAGRYERIDTVQLSEILQNITSLRNRLNTFVEKQNNIKKRMHDAWGGTSGDKAYEKLNKYEKKYDKYIKMLNKRIKFLKNIIETYSAWDNNISSEIDGNFSNKM